MFFQVIGKITRTETIAVGSKIREIGRLKRIYGPGRWRKRKGIADIRLRSGQYITVELH
jgi:hypothetical protein